MLSGLLWGLLWLLVAVLALLALALALPVRLRLAGRAGAVAALRVELGLFGGLVPRLPVYDSERPRKPKAKPKAGKPGRRPQRRRRAGRRRSGGGRPMRMLRAGPALVLGLLRTIRLELLRVDGVYGLGDPADTGWLYGTVAPVLSAGSWAAGPRVDVALRPAFDRACLEGEAELVLALRPILLLGPVLRFGWRVFGPAR